MEDNSKSEGHPVGCRCMKCMSGARHWGCCHGPWHVVIRVVALVVVFWFGVQFGELQAYRYGPGMMGGAYPFYYHMMGYGEGYDVYPASATTSPAR